MTPVVESLYSRLAPFYDVIYGASLQHGRTRAIQRLAPRAGESILEIGVGTGLSARLYPGNCRVAAVDLSAPMLARAQARIRRQKAFHVRLCQMDATRLAFGDAAFDAVFAPYVLNVVPDPVAMAREMLRVCRPAGRIVLLNHFDHERTQGRVNRMIGRLAGLLSGVNWNLNLDAFLRDTGLVAVDIEPVNIPRVSSVVLCRAQESSALGDGNCAAVGVARTAARQSDRRLVRLIDGFEDRAP